ncbi:MAG: enoyl-CoA hydratase/isomerase family protein [Burkholderiales bacterium]
MTGALHRVEFRDRLAIVRLDRPQSRNALSRRLMRDLTREARLLAERTDIDVVILTGDATCFSAGADLKDSAAWEGDKLSAVERRENAATGFRLCKAWEELPQISIVAIEGYAVGGGLALSLACDWRVMADDAFVSLPEIALGIPLTWGTIPRLTNLVGPARAKRLTILCERFTAAEALDMGLIDYRAPKGGALARALEVAAQTLAMPAAAVRMSKESANAAATALNHATGYMAHDQIIAAATSPEARAARAAFAARGKT